MALDHFVPQVHLRQFISAALPSQLHAIRKVDGFTFSPRPQDVCRSEGGNTNAYLEEPRAIEEFLQSVEPHYRAAVADLRDGATNERSVRVVAGFTAYIASCSPASMRLLSEPLRQMVVTATSIMEASGILPPPPEVLGGGSFSDLVRSGAVQVEVDERFPQAISIAEILRSAAAFEGFDWDVLHTSNQESPFLTSDFPVALEETTVPGVSVRVVPLAPDLAVRIVPRLHEDRIGQAPTPSIGRRRHRAIARSEVVKVNRLIVRCAENLVFFNRELPWIGSFVERNRNFRVEPVVRKIPTGRGAALIASLTVSPVRSTHD